MITLLQINIFAKNINVESAQDENMIRRYTSIIGYYLFITQALFVRAIYYRGVEFLNRLNRNFK